MRLFEGRSHRLASPPHGAITLYGAPFQGDWAGGSPDLPSADYNSDPQREPDFKSGLLPLHSPLLGQSQLLSFPPLIDMLKFSG